MVGFLDRSGTHHSLCLCSWETLVMEEAGEVVLRFGI